MKRHHDFMHAVLIAIVLFSCSNQREKQQSNYASKIIGEWLLTVKQINYPRLIFNQDSTAVFTSMGDTLYRYKYYVDKTDLVLKDINDKITRDKILKLDKDSLIFETLADNKEVQRYKRKED